MNTTCILTTLGMIFTLMFIEYLHRRALPVVDTVLKNEHCVELVRCRGRFCEVKKAEGT